MKKLFSLTLSMSLLLAPMGAQAQGGSYAQQILAISTAGIGTSILMTCPMGPMIPSMMAYGAGSLAYIGSEILGGKAQNENHKKKVSELELTEAKLKELKGGGELQRAAIETRLKEEEQTLAFINKRKTWTMATTAVYTGATALAAVELMRANVPGANLTPPGMIAGCGPTSEVQSSLVRKGLAAAFTFGASKASGGGMIGQYGSMGAAIATSMTSLGGRVAQAYNSPRARIVTFGASAALSGLVMKDLMDKSKVVSGNVEKLKKVLAEFDKETQTTGGLTTGGDTAGSSTGGSTSGGGGIDTTSGDLTLLADGNSSSAKHCWSRDGGLQYSTSSCKNPLQVTTPKFDASLNLPTLATASNLATEMANGVASGNLGAAEVAAGNLSSMAGRLDEVQKSVVKQMNDKLKASGKEKIDLNKEVDAQVASMMKDLNGGSAGAATLGSANGSEASALESEPSLNSNTSVPASATASNPVLNIGGPGEITEGSTSTGQEFAQVAAPVDPNANFDYEEKDVSDNQGVSLFKQVSNRYMFNYNKIFEKKKLEDSPSK